MHSSLLPALKPAVCVGDDFPFSCRAWLCHGNAAITGALHALSDIVCQAMKAGAALPELQVSLKQV